MHRGHTLNEALGAPGATNSIRPCCAQAGGPKVERGQPTHGGQTFNQDVVRCSPRANSSMRAHCTFAEGLLVQRAPSARMQSSEEFNEASVRCCRAPEVQ